MLIFRYVWIINKFFMPWFLYGLVHLFDECILYFENLYVVGIKIFLSLKIRLWFMYKFKYLVRFVSNKFWSFI